mmetsp:Transcript_17444/g.56142  ORF Transcript_17444/g.56142 Transcript_17444/m.56142 type:complete len:351 (-) Transcript_17444:2314-3366(-)
MVRVRFWYSVMMSFAFFSHWSRLSTSPCRCSASRRCSARSDSHSADFIRSESRVRSSFALSFCRSAVAWASFDLACVSRACAVDTSACSASSFSSYCRAASLLTSARPTSALGPSRGCCCAAESCFRALAAAARSSSSARPVFWWDARSMLSCSASPSALLSSAPRRSPSAASAALVASSCSRNVMSSFSCPSSSCESSFACSVFCALSASSRLLALPSSCARSDSSRAFSASTDAFSSASARSRSRASAICPSYERLTRAFSTAFFTTREARLRRATACIVTAAPRCRSKWRRAARPRCTLWTSTTPRSRRSVFVRRRARRPRQKRCTHNTAAQRIRARRRAIQRRTAI